MNIYYLVRAHALFMRNSLCINTSWNHFVSKQWTGMRQSCYTRTCLNQWWTHGQFSSLNTALCSATRPKKQEFSPCKTLTCGSGPWALIATSFSAQNKTIKLQIPSLLQRGGKLLPHVLFPYPAAILEFRLCTLSNLSHCENKGIKAIRGQGGKQRRGGGQRRAGGAGCVVPGPGGVWGCGGCVSTWRGIPRTEPGSGFPFTREAGWKWGCFLLLEDPLDEQLQAWILLTPLFPKFPVQPPCPWHQTGVLRTCKHRKEASHSSVHRLSPIFSLWDTVSLQAAKTFMYYFLLELNLFIYYYLFLTFWHFDIYPVRLNFFLEYILCHRCLEMYRWH